MDTQQEIKSEKKIARLISDITQPPVVSIPIFAIINYVLLGFNNSLVITMICWIFGAFLPITTSLILIRKMHTDMDITDRTKRTLPLFFAVCSYLIGFLVLLSMGAPALTTALMFIYSSNTLIILFINLSWKISIHTMGVAGPAVVLTYLFGILGLLFGLLIPLVMWSRVELKKHTISQVLAGGLAGIVLTYVQLYFILPLV
ncbi:MAG: PAP2 family protein [Methanobacterium sp.]|uniref:PAP2 family protein n=1 Tax=Methanobacterium sp. TaxID=2164 RepID=UPI003C7094B0